MKTEEKAIMAQEVVPVEAQAMTPAQYDAALAAAALKAKSLATIVEGQHLYTVMGDKKHLHIEAWTTLAQGYGYSVDIEWTRPVEGGGWEARSTVRNAVGDEVTHSEAEAGTKGDRTWINKPSFQQRSMAQTRANSKALASALRWVVVLAGYSPTPADEMIQEKQATEAQAPQREATEQDSRMECPLHPGNYHTKRSNEQGSWWSHRHGDGWCNASTPEVQEAAAQRRGARSGTIEAQVVSRPIVDVDEPTAEEMAASDVEVVYAQAHDATAAV
jgi:hypothetical protein